LRSQVDNHDVMLEQVRMNEQYRAKKELNQLRAELARVKDDGCAGINYIARDKVDEYARELARADSDPGYYTNRGENHQEAIGHWTARAKKMVRDRYFAAMSAKGDA
jgi:hypothetical protein